MSRETIMLDINPRDFGQPVTASRYQQYLQTPEWQETRYRAIMRADGHCQIC